MIAMAIFTIVTGTAFALFVHSQLLFTPQQNQAALNIAMRNSVAQLQLDVTNAGAGYFPNVPNTYNMPGWPVAVTIQNNVVSSTPPIAPCNTPATYTYGPNCFDSMNVITTDIGPTSAPSAIYENTPPSNPSNGAGVSVNISTTGTLYLQPAASTNPPPSPWPTAAALTSLAGDYHVGDEVLLVGGGSGATQYNAVVLTAAGVVSGNYVKITFSPVTAGTCVNPADPLKIATVPNSDLSCSFGPGDWAERIVSVTYTVDTSNPTDPQLDRCVNSPTCTAAGSKTVLADQIIGFKVGAAYFDPASSDTCGDALSTSDDTVKYYYDNNDVPPAGCQNKFTDLRAVQISLIGRTNPLDATTAGNYRNGFDGGPYQIEALSVIINPRNMSMNDN